MFTNKYIFTYASIMVILVAAILSTASMLLKPFQEANIKAEKIQGILAAANVETSRDQAEEVYGNKIVEELAVDSEGNVVYRYKSGEAESKPTERPFNIKLKEQLDRSSRFLMGISHDLKTPLASISGYVDAINDGFADDEEKLQRYMSIIATKTQLLESRISALIDYAKQETRDWKTTLERVALRPFLAEFASIVEVEAQARGFLLEAEIDIDSSAIADMDADMVTRALDNLAENAFAYATPGSTIRFAAKRSGESLQVVIENEGPGIDPDDLPHVFDPLYRASASRQGKGFGLGLSIVKSVITSHGWEIAVQSTAGETTSFTIAIPDQTT